MYGNYANMYSGMSQMPGAYQTRLDPMQQPQIQSHNIIHVNGENGARSFRMAPNSQCLLLDDTAPIIWLAQTDGAGYPTLTPYSITPYQAEPAPDFNSLDARIKRLEDMINGQSNVAEPKQKRKQTDNE